MADKPEQVKKERKPDGAWVVVDDQGQVHAVERAELRAWRIAGPLKGTVVFWPFGASREQVLRAQVEAHAAGVS
jgi:hypothetical protein